MDMNLVIWLIVGVFATWRLTWDITSCTHVSDEKGSEICEPNLEGPFRLYDFIRWFFSQSFWPKWVVDGSSCPYCVSMWAAGFVSMLLPVYGGLSFFEAVQLWLLCTLGISGAVAFWFRRLRLLYGLSAQES